jgi:hypothetical protein
MSVHGCLSLHSGQIVRKVRRVFDAAKLGAVVVTSPIRGSFLKETLFNQIFYVSIRQKPNLISSLEYAEDFIFPLQATYQAARILLVDWTGGLP